MLNKKKELGVFLLLMSMSLWTGCFGDSDQQGSSKLSSPSLSAFASNIDLIQEFDMEQIEITDPYYVNAFNKELDYLQFLEADRLLAGFREVSGLTAKSDTYGGWESTLLQGHTLGHFMSALSMAYKNTKNDVYLNNKLKEKIDYIIDELELCQNANGDGYLFATPTTHFDIVEGTVSGSSWVPWYTMHKILSGIIDIYKYGNNSKALSIASNLGDWIYNRVSGWDSETVSSVLNVEYGGMNDCLYELYKLTDNTNHLAAAHVFDEDSLFESISDGDNVLPNKHANTTIPKFIGALNRYRTVGTGETFYLSAAQDFWDMVVNYHTYVTGGNSENEHFRNPNLLDGRRNELNNETCNSYNMLKLTRGLFQITGDIKYADYYERTFINEIMASQNPETGMTTYFKAMGTGFFKVFSSETEHFWCCTGTGMENFTKLDNSIYFHTDSDLYINMYLSSVLNWDEKGLSLTQNSDIPSKDTVNFTINSAPDDEINLKLRLPSWLSEDESVVVKINDEAVNYSSSNGYIDLNRIWNTGDTIFIQLPMKVRASRLADNPNSIAFTYGPIVLSAGLGTENMTTIDHGVSVLVATKNVDIESHIIIDEGSVNNWVDNIEDNLVKTQDELEFTLRNTNKDDTLVFTPHYSRYSDRYGIYFNFIEPEVVSGQYYKLFNANSGKVLGVDSMSTEDGATVLQWSDNGTSDHNWRLDLQDSGYYILTNENSGKVLGISGMGLDNGSLALQWTDNGTSDHDWSLIALTNGNYKIINRNSGKLLGINEMSLENGASALQWEDNGTLDHEWSLVSVD